MRKLKILLLIAVIVSGCGYATGSLLPSRLKTIYVGPFRNKIELAEELTPEEYRFRTYRTSLETDITKEVIDSFINDGNLRVAKEENADLILSAELIDYLRQPVRYGADNEIVEEYRISIVCSVIVRDVGKDTILWQDGRVIGDSTYNISGTYARSETATVEVAISDLARRIVNRTIEGW
ncbi:MAG: LPS assembly lipoprotein LptE [Omnitrophica bacterium]|nr:LPS assembly lipoprotein LptE [Candidatus Omnitrophota bacterium]